MAPAGPYVLQAEIAAEHALRASAEATDWRAIAALYGRLEAVAPSPVVRLNGAVATAMAGDPERALATLDDLEASGDLASYHLLDASRAELLRRAGRWAEAAPAYEKAIGLATNRVEQGYLSKRLSEVRSELERNG
jgi:RNA polymerase sigma-70 factor (ECF subfamily)